MQLAFWGTMKQIEASLNKLESSFLENLFEDNLSGVSTLKIQHLAILDL